MKRKLIRRNKIKISELLKQSATKMLPALIEVSNATFESITRSKQRGQKCYQARLRRQEKLNPRQLKKLRKKQQRSGLIGSKFAGMCKTQLKPAAAIFKSSPPNG
ncbi:hypothetical protein [Rheinheimera texasensis]|uniref:hypothetical protein n=1 Tax=Rheinheimera texasensis TaxID=306205 RepID=UPI0032B228D6